MTQRFGKVSSSMIESTLREMSERKEQTEILKFIEGLDTSEMTQDLKLWLLKTWDETHYQLQERASQRSLTRLAKFRVRQRNPPPDNICPGGTRPNRALPSAATQRLTHWLRAYTPYPDKAQKQNLSRQTGLTVTQVSNWFANARRNITKMSKSEITKSSGANDQKLLTGLSSCGALDHEQVREQKCQRSVEQSQDGTASVEQDVSKGAVAWSDIVADPALPAYTPMLSGFLDFLSSDVTADGDWDLELSARGPESRPASGTNALTTQEGRACLGVWNESKVGTDPEDKPLLVQEGEREVFQHLIHYQASSFSICKGRRATTDVEFQVCSEEQTGPDFCCGTAAAATEGLPDIREAGSYNCLTHEESTLWMDSVSSVLEMKLEDRTCTSDYAVGEAALPDAHAGNAQDSDDICNSLVSSCRTMDVHYVLDVMAQEAPNEMDCSNDTQVNQEEMASDVIDAAAGLLRLSQSP